MPDPKEGVAGETSTAAFFLFTGRGIVVVAPARLEAHAVHFSRHGALLLFKTDKSLSVLTRTNLRGSEV